MKLNKQKFNVTKPAHVYSLPIKLFSNKFLVTMSNTTITNKLNYINQNIYNNEKTQFKHTMKTNSILICQQQQQQSSTPQHYQRHFLQAISCATLSSLIVQCLVWQSLVSQVTCDSNTNNNKTQALMPFDGALSTSLPLLSSQYIKKATKPLNVRSIVNFESIVNAIELQHLALSDKHKKAKFDSGIDSISLVDKTPLTHQSSIHSTPFVSLSDKSSRIPLESQQAMQSILMSHELSTQRNKQQHQQDNKGNSSSSSSRNSKLLAEAKALATALLPSKQAALSGVLSYVSPMVASGGFSSLLPSRQALQSQTANNAADLLTSKKQLQVSRQTTTANNSTRLQSALRKTARSVSSTMLLHAHKDEARKTATTATATTTTSNKLRATNSNDNVDYANKQQLTFRSASKRPATFIGKLGDKVLHAAMIKPSLSFQDLISEPSSNQASLIGNNNQQASSSSSVSKAVVNGEHLQSAASSSLAPQSTQTSSAFKGALKKGAKLVTIRNNSASFGGKVLQESMRNLLTLTQLPLLTSNSQQLPIYASIMNAASNIQLPSLISNNKNINKKHTHSQSTTSSLPSTSSATSTQTTTTTNDNSVNKKGSNNNNADTVVPAALSLSEQKRKLAVEEFLRFAYIITKRLSGNNDPLKALASTRPSLNAVPPNKTFSQRSKNPLASPNRQFLYYLRQLRNLLLGGPRLQLPTRKNHIRPRGVMWDMATDPSLAVTVFHLLESASVALPLGFLLMPFVQMMKNPLNGIHLSRGLNSIWPTRASHRSVDYEELAKRLDIIDRVLSRALRQTHRESTQSFSFG